MAKTVASLKYKDYMIPTAFLKNIVSQTICGNIAPYQETCTHPFHNFCRDKIIVQSKIVQSF